MEGRKIETKEILAVRAVVVNSEGKILIIRESSGYTEGNNVGRWDFPGGRVEPGEIAEVALLREVREESGLDVEIGSAIFTGKWNPLIGNEQLKITGTFFKCVPKNLNVVLSSDHDKFLWIDPKNEDQYDLIPPNEEVLKALGNL